MRFKVGDLVRVKPDTYNAYAAFNNCIGTVVRIEGSTVWVKTDIIHNEFPDGRLPTDIENLVSANNGIERALEVLKGAKCRS